VEGEELAGAWALQGAGDVQKLIAGWPALIADCRR
jgi:hypothetical protein